MAKKHSSENFGPLPQQDRNAQLEQLSIKAFRSVLPIDRFLFREERIDDKGVDGSLELLSDGRYTNLRSQVQLKSTESSNPNSDGVVTVQVKSSNLNYLLNGQSPIYVLYIVSRNELRFLWARDEQNRLDQANPQWMKPGKVSLRFKHLLTAEALDGIYERVRQEAQAQRRIFDIVGRASLNETVVISIDPESLTTTDPEEVKEILLSSGTILTSSGYATNVRDMVSLLSPAASRMPRIQLVKAHAETTLCRYKSALASIAEAEIRSGELSVEDRQFLVCLRGLCEYQTGKISISEFNAKLANEASNHEWWFTISQRLNQSRFVLMNEQDLAARAVLLSDFRLRVNEVLGMDGISDSLKLHASLLLLEAEGGQMMMEFQHERHHQRLRFSQGFPTNLTTLLKTQLERSQDWESKINDALQSAIKLNHPLLMADALTIRSSIRIMELIDAHTLGLMFNLPLPSIPGEAVSGLKHDVERAIDIYKRADQLEGELRAKMHLADLYAIVGQDSLAQEIAAEVLPKAKIMDYVALRERAEDHIAGKAPIKYVKEVFSKQSIEDKDIKKALDDGQLLKQTAREIILALNLPSERLPILERALFAQRDIARERLDWCQFIELIEDLTHSQHPSTYYQKDPDLYCICKFHQYESAIGNPDRAAVISAFKQTFCAGCPDRSPRQK